MFETCCVHLSGALAQSKQRVSPFFYDLDLVGLVGRLLEQLLNSIFFQSCFKEIFGGGRGDAYTFSYMTLSSFHSNNFRDTIGWECIVKDDGIRSCLIELQSILLSKIDVNPIHCVLMSLPCFTHVLCKSRCIQVDRFRILVFFLHRIHRQKEYCLSVSQILTSRYQS